MRIWNLAITTLLASLAVAHAQAPAPAQPAPPAKALGRVHITEAMAKIKPQITACGDQSPAVSGIVKIKVRVAAAGTVELVELLATPDKTLGECVVTAMKGATFARTEAGGTFSYPLSFTKLPAALDRLAISNGMKAARPAVMACGTKHKGDSKGTVKVAVKVAPDGTVANVEVKAAPVPELGVCVADAIKPVTFKKTQQGGSFTYPFVF